MSSGLAGDRLESGVRGQGAVWMKSQKVEEYPNPVIPAESRQWREESSSVTAGF